jgi:hypothetical protein
LAFSVVTNPKKLTIGFGFLYHRSTKQLSLNFITHLGLSKSNVDPSLIYRYISPLGGGTTLWLERGGVVVVCQQHYVERVQREEATTIAMSSLLYPMKQQSPSTATTTTAPLKYRRTAEVMTIPEEQIRDGCYHHYHSVVARPMSRRHIITQHIRHHQFCTIPVLARRR